MCPIYVRVAALHAAQNALEASSLPTPDLSSNRKIWLSQWICFTEQLAHSVYRNLLRAIYTVVSELPIQIS